MTSLPGLLHMALPTVATRRYHLLLEAANTEIGDDGRPIDRVHAAAILTEYALTVPADEAMVAYIELVGLAADLYELHTPNPDKCLLNDKVIELRGVETAITDAREVYTRLVEGVLEQLVPASAKQPIDAKGTSWPVPSAVAWPPQEVPA